jgi:hypothetical protein
MATTIVAAQLVYASATVRSLAKKAGFNTETRTSNRWTNQRSNNNIFRILGIFGILRILGIFRILRIHETKNMLPECILELVFFSRGKLDV